MNLTEERLYQLLPAIHRIRDSEHGGALRALIAVIAEQARVVEADIAQLYDNAFIETCDEWVVPYLGDLLGVRGLHEFSRESSFTQRGRVANTLAYRRRKGTAAVLEQLAFDTTGWRARAVEFFERLEWTQHQNHLRPFAFRTPDLRRTETLELLDGPFETALHTPEVRSIRSGRGRYNLPNVGLFLWRLGSYSVTRATAGQPASAPPEGFTFDPLGRDLPLFNRPQTETEITHLAEEINVPGRLRRRPLFDELEDRRRALASGTTPAYRYFDDRPTSVNPPVLRVYRPGTMDPISADEIAICHLGEWTLPPDSLSYDVVQPDGTVVAVNRPIAVAVDPWLGRLAFPASTIIPEPPRVSFAYGFSADLGGGPYNRLDAVETAFDRIVTWPVAVSRELTPVPGQVFASLTDAVDAWNNRPSGEFGVILILDSASYTEDLTGPHAIQIPEGSRLLIVAADWPAVRVPGGLPGRTTLALTEIDPDELRPHLKGQIEVHGTAPAGSETPGEFLLNGLLLEGGLTVTSGRLGRVSIAHATLQPGGDAAIVVETPDSPLILNLEQSLCGRIRMSGGGTFTARESILDVPSGLALDAPSVAARFASTTVFGEVEVLRLEADNTLFNEPVVAERRQEGCVRFCWVPSASQVPRRYRCQPALSIPENATQEEAAAIELRLRPSFTARAYGDPAYAQLSATCATEIRTGAEDGSEIGAFQGLQQPQREANLKTTLESFLRFGLEAGLIYAT